MIKHYYEELRRWHSRHLRFDFYPYNNLLFKDKAWVANGNDPAFILFPHKKQSPPRGWYMITITIAALNHSHLNTKIYSDYGKGFHEEHAISLTVQSGHPSKRLCYFPRIPVRLRFDPCDVTCTFTINTFCLSKVPKWFAKDRMAKKLLVSHQAPVKTKTGNKRTSLKELWIKYNDFFSRQHYLYQSIDYQQWLHSHERNRAEDTEAEQLPLPYKPLISIIVPVWNTPEPYLRKCLESVLRQSYPDWQLCLADDGSTMYHVKETLTEYAAQDHRIVLINREQNGHICKASNSALALAKGEFVALLDHDDELADNALFEVVSALNKNPDLDILYSDEDLIDDQGYRSNPHFKSDWNPELIRAHNYITHLCVYRNSLLKQVEGFRTDAGVEGAQDYDLVLRCSARTTPERIHHIPKILYHWRAHSNSTASAAGAKHYSVNAGHKALQEHLDSLKINAQVELTPRANFFRVAYSLTREPVVSILIPTRDMSTTIQNCVSSILQKTTYSNYEIVILDNQSRQSETLEWFEKISVHPKIRILSCDFPFNYAAINNIGAAQAKGEILALVNNDVEVISPGWLDEMTCLAIQEKNGCIGAKLYYPDDTIQHGGVIIGLGGYAAHSHRGYPRNHPGYFNRLNVRQNLSAVTGACMVVRREIWQELNGLDEMLAVGYNDVDFCLRVREAGYLNVFTPFAELYHYESKSRGPEDSPAKIARFKREKEYLLKRWGTMLNRDPYYNPNLTKSREDFSLAH